MHIPYVCYRDSKGGWALSVPGGTLYFVKDDCVAAHLGLAEYRRELRHYKEAAPWERFWRVIGADRWVALPHRQFEDFIARELRLELERHAMQRELASRGGK